MLPAKISICVGLSIAALLTLALPVMPDVAQLLLQYGHGITPLLLSASEFAPTTVADQ